MYSLSEKFFCNPMVFLTSIIALATVMYMVFTAMMWLSMRKSINLNKQIFVSSNRPYIGISDLSVKFENKDLPNPFFRYINFGTVPAKEVILEISLILNFKKIFSKKFKLDNLFIKKERMWGDTIESKFTKDILSENDTFEIVIDISYFGIAKTRYTTKERLKYDYGKDIFSISESNWN